MEDFYFYEFYLDDYALFMDGLLSEEDAREMYQRGEISRQQLADYIYLKQNQTQQQADQNTNPWVVAVITLIIIVVCLCAVLSGF